MHRMPVAIQRIEARVRVPGLVEMDAIDARVEQFLHAFRVVAKAVVGGVRDHRVHGARAHVPGHQRIGLDRRLERLLLQPLRRNRADDAVAIAQRNQVVRNAARHHQAVLDRLVAVAIAERDLPATHGRHEDHAIRHRRAVGDAVGAMRAEHARRVPLVFAHRPRMIEQRTECADADRQVRTQQVLAVEVEEDAAHRRLEEGGTAGVARRMPRVLVLLREPEQRRGQRRHDRGEVAADGGHDAPADECRRILESPDELVDHLHHFDRNARRFTSFGHEEDRDLVVARAQRLDERVRVFVVLAVAQPPIDEHDVDRGIRGDDRRSVRGGSRFHHFDAPPLHLLHQRADRATFRGRVDRARRRRRVLACSIYWRLAGSSRVLLVNSFRRARLRRGRAPEEECLRPVVERTEPALCRDRRSSAMDRWWPAPYPRPGGSRRRRAPVQVPACSCVNSRSTTTSWSRFVGVDGAEHHGAIAEEHVHLAVEHRLDARAVVRNRA